MSEKETAQIPFTLAILSVFFGFLAAASLFSSWEDYILFSIVLPRVLSAFITVIEAVVLGFISYGLYKQMKVAQKVLIYYSMFSITDILTTLILIDKDTLTGVLKDASLMDDFANINLTFCIIFFALIRYARRHNGFFVN